MSDVATIHYIGERLDTRPGFFVDRGGQREPLPRVAYHTALSLEWVDADGRASDLALSILAHALNDLGRAWDLHQLFKWQIVRFLPPESWQLSQDEILSWAARHPAG